MSAWKAMGWVRPILAMLAGVLGVGGFAPVSEPAWMVLALAILIRLLEGVTWRQGLVAGFCFGLGHFSLGFSWLLTSLHDNGGIPWVPSYLVLFLLAAVMGIYPALFGAVLPLCVRRPLTAMLAAPALWTITEWLRTWVFTGFPWNLVGYVWSPWETILQVADLGGVFLLSWLTVLLGSALVVPLRRPLTWGVPLLALGLAGISLAAAHGYGVWRLDTLSRSMQSSGAPPLKAALIQGNIAQNMKWIPENLDQTMKTYFTLTRAVSSPVDIVVWPETAVPFFLQLNPNYQERLGHLSAHMRAPILTGVPTANPEERHGERTWRFFNSVIMITGKDAMDRRYDKHHLVPFGEFIPARWLVPKSIEKLTGGGDDFIPGPGPFPMPWEKGDLGILICYEIIFPEEVRQLAEAGARWLINVTNDGWFGEAAKPQHLAMARMRTIETRLPLLRVANTGISAAIDARGRELARISPNQRDHVLATIPPAPAGTTFYRRIGSTWMAVFAVLLLFAWIHDRSPRLIRPTR
ncbi:MAG: apolipoprotein N-acyltransferase [Magnetococcales bacterium]|nr:apolipoprotein N-acyltransferase [Magnetococcales bacterium]MBF0323157.1 apolipoprotein N-acyltransferase [Magnetococcales bacterium]